MRTTSQILMMIIGAAMFGLSFIHGSRTPLTVVFVFVTLVAIPIFVGKCIKAGRGDDAWADELYDPDHP